jgi:hypothetical protein
MEEEDRKASKLARAELKQAQRKTKKVRGRVEKNKKPTRLKKQPVRDADDNFAQLVKSCRKAQITVDQPMVLISQAQRSGGTLMRNLFDGHPQCHVHPYEWHFGRGKRFHWPNLRTDHPPEQWWVRLQEEALDRRFQTGVRADPSKYRGDDSTERSEIYPFLTPPLLQRQLFLEEVNDIIANREVTGDRDILNAYMTSLFNGWLNNQTLREPDKRWVVTFAPRLAWGERRAKFFNAYPDGHLITIVRSPYSWLASTIGRQIKEVENSERLLQAWKESARQSIAAKEEYGDQVTVISFEELVRAPETTMRLLADRLGIDYTDSLTEPTFNSRPVGANSSYLTGTSGVIDSRPLNRYKKILSKGEEGLVAEQCGELYEAAKRLSEPAAAAGSEPQPDQASTAP